MPQITQVWQESFCAHGADKIWRALNRMGTTVARCTVERLMQRLQLQGALRGKEVRTTIPDDLADRPSDLVKRQFKADRPNQLWVSDFTYVSTWQGWLYVAFVIDVYARYIVGWRVSRSMTTDFVLDALEQALYARQPDKDGGLIHHSEKGCNISLFTIQSVWPQLALHLQWGARVMATITPLLKPSMVYTRRK